MRRQVLFVDDEPHVLEALRRMLHRMRRDWEMHFAGSALEALEVMEKVPIDVLVCDVRMPRMDGAQLLAEVRQRHPEVTRIALSGHADEEAELQTGRLVHHFLQKPCDLAELQSAIVHACPSHGMTRDGD